MSITAAMADVVDNTIVRTIELSSPAFDERPAWYGLRSQKRAKPLSDLGILALGLHLATTTPKER